MGLARVLSWGANPKYSEADVPKAPPPGSEESQVTVNAAAVHSIVRLRTLGRHYSARILPHVPGVDGVGTTASGKRVYFFTFGASIGSFAEVVNVPKTNIVPLPEGIDNLEAAALVNPAMSSWMALRKRAIFLPPNFSVLILGVTSLSGQLAINMSRALGAGKVIGISRNENKLANAGLHQWIRLKDDVLETDFSSVGDVDIVLDYLYGAPAIHLLQNLKSQKTLQYINIGDLAGRHVALPSSVMRSQKVLMMASGVGSWTIEELREELPELLEAMKQLSKQKLKVIPLKDIERRWNEPCEDVDRVVYTPS